MGLRQPTQPVLAAIRQMSHDTAALWKVELHEAALLLSEFAAWLVGVDQPRILSTFRHAADGCVDLCELVGIYVSRRPLAETPESPP